jgi:hypothetical protein
VNHEIYIPCAGPGSLDRFHCLDNTLYRKSLVCFPSDSDRLLRATEGTEMKVDTVIKILVGIGVLGGFIAVVYGVVDILISS